jgi:DNA polymerase-3 subunit gamma/tau
MVRAARFTAASLLRAMDLIATARTDMRESPNHRLLLEVAMVRAAAPETDPSSLGLLGRIERLERRIGVEGAVPAASSAPPEARPVPSEDRTPQPAAIRSRPSVEPVPEVREAPEPAGTTRPDEAPAVPAPPAEVGLGHVKEAWAATLREVGKRSKRVAAYLHASRPVEYDGNVLVVDVQSDFHAGAMSEARNRELVIEALQSSLGIRPQVAFGTQDNRPAAAEAADGDHEIVAEGPDPIELVKKGFGAEIVEET